MNTQNKVKAFAKLYGLLTFYYENRDQPVENDFDFFAEVEGLCTTLDLDFEEFKREFKLTNFTG
ncbi:hypothetical protein ACLIBH_03820 [Virgibacillus sp. W0430]|uniref:hypothetical protein n=1 Tax=Virgibacillus sp. W0430 TaxID=3391580 RepID=UPI003F48FB96